MTVTWRPRAEADLASQLAHIESPKGAARLLSAVERAVMLLEDFPEIGRPTPRKNVRELVVPRTPFVIVYQLERDDIVLLRVFHGAQSR